MKSGTEVVVELDTTRIVDWVTFHSVCSEALGFPGFYGANMNAWIDCMTYVDEPDAGMTSVHCRAGGMLTLKLTEATRFAERCPDQFNALQECTAFVNWRRLERGDAAVLALAYWKDA